MPGMVAHASKCLMPKAPCPARPIFIVVVSPKIQRNRFRQIGEVAEPCYTRVFPSDMKCFLALILLCWPVLPQSVPPADQPSPQPKLADTLGTAALLLM